MRERATPDSVRPNNFDALRLALAVAVIYAHAYRLATRDQLDPLARFSAQQTDFGGVAVLAFFGISGYLITASCERSRSALEYLSRRVRRVYPAYIVALAISAFVVSPLFVTDGSHVDASREAVKFALWCIVLNPWTHTHAFAANPLPGVINGSLWTVQYEFACYGLLLAAAMIGALRHRAGLVAIALAFYAVHVGKTLGWIRLSDFSAILVRVGSNTLFIWTSTFLAGSVARTFRDRIAFRALPAVGCVALLAVACRVPTVHAFAIVVPPAFTYVVLTIAFAPIRLAENFARRIGGDYSYGTYLYAFPIQQMLVALHGGAMRPMANFAIATPLALLCGVASWHAIEKRFVRRDRREAVATIVPDDANAISTAPPY